MNKIFTLLLKPFKNIGLPKAKCVFLHLGQRENKYVDKIHVSIIL